MKPPSQPSKENSDREIELAASRWIGRRDAGMTPEENRAFEAWRRADPRHERAFARHESTWRLFDRPAGAGQADELVTALARSRARRRQRRQAALATCLVLAFALGLAWQRSRGPDATPRIADARSGGATVILPERQTLPDGSIVEVKQGAEFAVTFTDNGRRVELRRGEVLFHVVKDSHRPFVVSAGNVAVRAVGTAFSVQFERDEVGVLVTEGRVAVATTSRPAPPATAAGTRSASGAPESGDNVVRDAAKTMLPKTNATDASASSVPPGAEPEPMLHLDVGQRTVVTTATIAPPRVETLSSAEVAAQLAWRSPRLEFTATPLQEAIELFNRYATEAGARRLVIEPADQSLAQLEVSGYFRANNVTAFLHLISETLGVTAEARDDRIALRRTR